MKFITPREIEYELREYSSFPNSGNGTRIIILEVGDTDLRLEIQKEAIKYWSDNHEDGCTDYDYSKLKGEKINLEEFLGKFFDLKNKRIISPGKTPVCDGYVIAFTRQPYTKDEDLEKKDELFGKINGYLLNDFKKDNLEIYKWNTNWSNWFWSTTSKDNWQIWDHLWTIYNKEKGIVIIIVGSWTD